MIHCIAAVGWMGLLATTEFVERPITDFDVVVKELAAHGTWVPHETREFVFRPAPVGGAAWAPYREGRWLYTDYGWTWRGESPGSWATDHYGFWFRESGQWLWVPGLHWLGATVEWLQSGAHIGWRCSPLDRFGNPTETEGERYADPAQWNFVLREKLRGPLTAADFVDDVKAADLLVKAKPADHIFMTYRQIERPGPPPDILADAEGKLSAFPVVRELLEPGELPEIPAAQSVYAYRPRFHQDATGILRRVELFLNPRAENPEYQRVRDTLMPQRALTPKEEKVQRDAAELEKTRRQHEQDIYR
jgi:hypothetical protein